VWLWHLLADARLPAVVRDLIDESVESCWLSPISLWETRLLVERGRFEIDGDFRDWIEESGRVLPLRSAPVTDEVALTCFETELPHPDPADRFLAATAMVYDLALVTADRRLLACRSLPTVPASA
jgi:PIN domain nuclease of toxin-antitoxin system